jgi:hypothetical protein
MCGTMGALQRRAIEEAAARVAMTFRNATPTRTLVRHAKPFFFVLPAGPRPSHRHLRATRRPDDKFYLGYRPGRGGYSPDRIDALVWAFSELLVEQMPSENVFELYRRQAEAAAQRSKAQPAQTVPQPGSVEWFKAQQNKS